MGLFAFPSFEIRTVLVTVGGCGSLYQKAAQITNRAATAATVMPSFRKFFPRVVCCHSLEPSLLLSWLPATVGPGIGCVSEPAGSDWSGGASFAPTEFF